MSEKHGIKETKEVIQAMSKIHALLATKLEDGFQWSDAVSAVTEMLADEEIKAAFSGALEIRKEVADLSGAEVSELVQAGVAEGIEIVNFYLKK